MSLDDHRGSLWAFRELMRAAERAIARGEMKSAKPYVEPKRKRPRRAAVTPIRKRA